ncbi:hypothetical protein LFYK43_16710 [Ligilactobacillus salitolerans]|uniref:Uncharacterized protein n=1 Tax=Ligilactobacillus salitolerans TaxID=1808352 RepID=A0A401IUK5_9LACO|nr:hypothetical protein [Ligilactobacillus salitolerans]GBG95212.1 hypothetical protein LFYK43_16710 [Ligilactobacillus salitolerans]
MTKIIKQRQKGFTTIDNKVIRDDKLSWKARGIFAYLWSQADDWNFYETEIAKHSADGRDSLRSGLKELETVGYLKRKRVRNGKGQVTDSEWILTDKPMLNEPMLKNPTQVNTTLRNTNLKNNQLEEILTERKENSAIVIAPRSLASEFEEIWNQYPNKKGKQQAFNHYKAWRKKSSKNTNEYLFEKLELYKKHLAANSWKQPMNGATWFNGRFDDQLEVEQKPQERFYE